MKKKNIFILMMGIVLFLFVSYWALSGNSVVFDERIYVFLHMLPKHIAQPFFLFITKFGNTDFCILLIAFLMLVFIKKDGLTIAGVGILDVALNQSLKYIFKRPRPSVEHLVHASGYSFPSGHTMIAIMLYGYLLYFINTHVNNPWIKNVGSGLCIFLMIFIPMSRIYVGVHYPSDILGGIIIGFTALYFYIQGIIKCKN